MIRRQGESNGNGNGKHHDEEEMVSFLGTGAASKNGPARTSTESGSSRTIGIVPVVSVLCGIVFLATGLSFSGALDSKPTTTSSSSNISSSSSSISSNNKISSSSNNNISHPPVFLEDGTISFECPESFEILGPEADAEAYAVVSEQLTRDRKEFLATFRETTFDEWDQTYTFVKKGLSPFKKKYYPKYLTNGAHIYESAMGIGLNLYMTLEILSEADPPVSGITVYGNDYVAASAARANDLVLAEGVLPEGNRKGVLCAGNSLDLGHVPTGAFDLVYTGYVSPLMDPLGMSDGTVGSMADDDASYWGWYDEICESFRRKADASTRTRNRDWMGAYLWEKLVVPKQREWFGKWVGEMARIAKPGVPVIVESVSQNYCDYDNDWGGVAKSFWKEAATENTYGWNVDPDSIEMMDDTVNEERYHVFMIKKKQ